MFKSKSSVDLNRERRRRLAGRLVKAHHGFSFEEIMSVTLDSMGLIIAMCAEDRAEADLWIDDFKHDLVTSVTDKWNFARRERHSKRS